MITPSHKDAMAILDAGLSAARPQNHISQYIKKNKLVAGKKLFHLSKYDKIWLVAVGKAADTMAKSAHDILQADGGIIVIPHRYDLQFANKKYLTIKSGHPTPDKNSVLAARKIIAFLQKMGKNDLAVFLISGGASSLVCAPDGISLAQKKQVTQELLKSGASISEINAIRKHLSKVKGGRILEHLRCDAVSFVMSDVVGDDLGSIGSGMVYCDKSTFSDCLGVIEMYGLRRKIPKKAITRLYNGAQGKIPETPKKPIIPNVIIARNSDCIDVMVKKAKSLGYHTSVLAPITGDVGGAANKILKKFSFEKKSCLVFGGETTVQVRGNGKGGRNQELVLHIIHKMRQNAIVASIGTDGIDGNTKHAGAIFDHVVPKNIITPYLKNNDSNSFFKKHGGLVLTGPTHTNLLDVGLIMIS